MSLAEHADLENELNDRFGLDEFRPGQREVIEHVLKGRDVLCVMPTGGGKSLCYQFPAVMLEGLTLVISPLIALMKDQVDALTQRGLRATLINSTLDPVEQRARMAEIEAGLYDLVYVAPERFRSVRFVETIARLKPALLAVDEAHCISQWGHDFRPDYARIGRARKALGDPPCIALTATATDLVRRDISDQLELRDPAVFVAGFDRPNLTYGVIDASRDADKLVALARTLDECKGPAIVYASSRLRCEDVAGFLRKELRRQTVVYHAGMTREDRTLSQERFMTGDAEIVVATNAFGMGVDKADVRAVVHFNMPGTLEAYYQEAGRAGRDGTLSRCVLLFSPGDRSLQEMFIENEYPPPEAVHSVYEFLRKLDNDPIELTQAEIKNEAGIGLGESAVGTALKLLEGAGAIERFLPRENMAIIRINGEGDESGDGGMVHRIGPQAHVQRTVLLALEGLVNRRHGEQVYFQPEEFASALGLDRPALYRALKALTSELPIDYVPPFRGNAIRVTDRARRARDIKIDFARLLKRKQGEYEKLDRVIQYAKTRHCRRAFLLEYFGDANAKRLHCGSCDNCGDDPSVARVRPSTMIDTAGGLEVILKVLSGIARAKGRVGKTAVAQMLKGSGSERVEKLGLRKLSTFGILPDFAQPELTQLIDALTSAGFVEAPEIDRFRPIVQLSATGWDYLKTNDRGPVSLEVPEELAAKVNRGGLIALPSRPQAAKPETGNAEGVESDPGGYEDDPLYQQLKALRLEWSRAENRPAYHVMTNATLDVIVRTRPTTPPALAAIRGFSPAKLERYGAAILEAVAAFPLESSGIEEPEGPVLPFKSPAARPVRVTERPPPAVDPAAEVSTTLTVHPPPPDKPRSPVRASNAYVPTEEWTWRLLDRGFTLDEVSAIRGLERLAVIRHMALAVRQGKAVAPEAYLPAETIERWSLWCDEKGETPPPPEMSGEGVAELWSLFLAGRRPR